MGLRALARLLSTVLLLAGTSLIAFPLFWISYTAWQVRPVQSAALAAWEEQTSAERAERENSSHLLEGFILTIPGLGLKRYVPEGAAEEQLRRYGVGHITWTAVPDQEGIVGIAGHRTTYGAPFFRLNRLARGDSIVIDYRGKRFAYKVTDRRIVSPRQVEVLRGSRGERGIALVTCTPVYSAAYRLVILGTQQ